MKTIITNLTTNLTQNECFAIGLNAPGYLGYETVSGSVPVEGSYRGATIRGMAVLEIDFEKNKEFLHRSIYGKTED